MRDGSQGSIPETFSKYSKKNFIMIRYQLKQNKIKDSKAYNKWYAYPVVEETMNLADLAHHMEEHNSGFSEAMCTGVMKAMVKCIKEQILSGKNVKIDDLAIFSVGIRNSKGADKEEDFLPSNNIAGVKLRARATGVLRNSNLNLDATLRKVGAYAVSGGKKTAESTAENAESHNGGSGENTDL